tara:strand:- start:1163 stop:1864 length:702 start_codon:yes stop_codon:yes gene_type:complete
MNYGEIEKQTFRTFLAFSTLLLTLILVFFNITSKLYRVSKIDYDHNLDLNMSSIESFVGDSIWLIDDRYFDAFYEENPSVERVNIKKELPNILVVKITTSEQLAFIEDYRQSPPKSFILHKNLYTLDTKSSEGLMSIRINNGPIDEGFFEEIITFVMTLKKYPVNLSNILVSYDGESMKVEHFQSKFILGTPSDLARKAAVLGYYISEEPCNGEVRLVYSDDGKEIRAVANCN